MPAGHAVLDSRGSHEYAGMTVQGHGWAAFTQLLEHPFAREFYAFAPRSEGGSIHRYRWTTRGVRSAGAVHGFGDLKGITFISSQADKDVLLANTSTGRLLAITIPRTERMTTSIARLRTRSWQAFERLVASPCGRGTTLLGIDDDTGRGNLYDLGPLAAASTTIRSVPGTVPTATMRVIGRSFG